MVLLLFVPHDIGQAVRLRASATVPDRGREERPPVRIRSQCKRGVRTRRVVGRFPERGSLGFLNALPAGTVAESVARQAGFHDKFCPVGPRCRGIFPGFCPVPVDGKDFAAFRHPLERAAAFLPLAGSHRLGAIQRGPFRRST